MGTSSQVLPGFRVRESTWDQEESIQFWSPELTVTKNSMVNSRPVWFYLPETIIASHHKALTELTCFLFFFLSGGGGGWWILETGTSTHHI